MARFRARYVICLRLWSIHPKYLDAQGLVALWREGLLAKKVLENKTKGYRNHPQLNRFKSSSRPLSYMNAYLHFVCDEAFVRGYSFKRTKLGNRSFIKPMKVTRGQMNYEWKHLLKKLSMRSRERFVKLKGLKRVRPHPIFKPVRGEVEEWEIL